MITPLLLAWGVLATKPGYSIQMSVPAAPRVSPPQIVFLDQPFGWIPTTVGLLQFVLLAGLTYYIFRRNYQQKTMERKAEWYHRLVMDFAIENITLFASTQTKIVSDLASAVNDLKSRRAPTTEIDDAIRRGLASFQDALYEVVRPLGSRLEVFSTPLEHAVTDRSMQLDDEVSQWFATEATARPGESRIALTDLLRTWQSKCLQLIRDYEFERWE